MEVVIYTKEGLVKQTELNNLPVNRYSRPMCIFKLKGLDEVVSASMNEGDAYIVTKCGFVLKFNKEEIPVVGCKTSGVKGIKLKDNDEVISGFITNETHEYITVFTDKNTYKRVKLEEIDYSKRSLKGDNILKSPKSKTYNIIKSYLGSSKTNYGLIDENTKFIKSSDINIMDKLSVGSSFGKNNIEDVFKEARLKVIDETSKIDVADVKEVVEKQEELDIKVEEVKEEKEAKPKVEKKKLEKKE